MESMVVWYDTKMQMLDKMTVVKKRQELLTLLDGDVFYDISKWPWVMEQSFWRKPIGDVDVFKLLLFTIGNGCPPSFISEWIMLSQYWCFSREKCLKRGRQIDFIVKNMHCNSNKWYYFDLHVGHQLYLNGSIKNKQ